MAKVSGGAQAKGKRVPGQEAQQSASDGDRIKEDAESLPRAGGQVSA